MPVEVTNGPQLTRWKSRYCDSNTEILVLPKLFKDMSGEDNLLASIIRLSNTPESCLALDTKSTIAFLSNRIFSHSGGY